MSCLLLRVGLSRLSRKKVFFVLFAFDLRVSQVSAAWFTNYVASVSSIQSFGQGLGQQARVAKRYLSLRLATPKKLVGLFENKS